MKGKEKEKKKS
uniref:Uncharacterized protein n=1 Tax=Anguilla anguilla TaxID=7936 RepID=A0A0E9PQL7_ANGAN